MGNNGLKHGMSDWHVHSHFLPLGEFSLHRSTNERHLCINYRQPEMSLFEYQLNKNKLK
jgi:hypothetical protein